MKLRIVIIGGVAGGASAATRARRLDEHAEITIIERGPYVSFANCGLPYHIGGVIQDRNKLMLQTPQSLHARYNLNVLVLHEALRIDRAKKELIVKNLSTSQEFAIPYDKLILSPGAEAFIPPIAGINSSNVFTLKTIPDLDRILEALSQRAVQHATVIGGGFIGLETAENLAMRGIKVALVEKDIQVMPPLDPEMATDLHKELTHHGVELNLGAQAMELTDKGDRTMIALSTGKFIETDLAILAIGVRPEVKLARDAGLRLGQRGGITVNDMLQTSDPDILAVGDAIETADFISGFHSCVALAGPANRQGRLAANSALNSGAQSAAPHKDRGKYRGTLGTWVCKVFDLTVAQTGNSEKTLKRLGTPYKKLYLHPSHHATYYPGASPMTIKLLFNPHDETILGAQIIGKDGIDKRIDVLATAIYAKLTVSQLADLELAYAPPYSSAKDPINYAGMIAGGLISKIHLGLNPDELLALEPDSYLLLDIRTAAEHQHQHIPNSTNIPVDDLRSQLANLPKDKEIIVYCQVGLRGYLAQRILTQQGFTCRNLLGGLKAWLLFNEMHGQQGTNGH